MAEADVPFHATATALSVIRHTITHVHDAEALLAGLTAPECEAVGAALLQLLDLACDQLMGHASYGIDASTDPDMLIVVAENVRAIHRELAYYHPPEDRTPEGIDAMIVAELEQGIAHHLIEHPDD